MVAVIYVQWIYRGIDFHFKVAQYLGKSKSGLNQLIFGEVIVKSELPDVLWTVQIPSLAYHRLNGSSSPVLTATPHSYGKGQNSTPCKIKTPERIRMKFCTVDYVLEISPQNKFGDDRSSGGFWVNMWNIWCLLLSLFFSPTDLEVTPPNQFSRGISQTTWIHA